MSTTTIRDPRLSFSHRDTNQDELELELELLCLAR